VHGPSRTAWGSSLLGIGAALVLSVPAETQVRVPQQRPGDERPQLPEIEAPETPPAVVLPPLTPTPPAERERLAEGPRLLVRGYRFEGNTAFDDEQLAALAAPYTGREVGSGELEALRLAITRLYVDAGYVNSGAVIPDQRPEGGVVGIRIVEGTLASIEIEGNRHFRTGYLRRRLALASGPPLDVSALEERLQILQQDPRIRRLDAELGPGPRRGEAELRVRLEEESPYRLWLELSNYESPSVGAGRARIRASHENLTGNGDTLSAMFSVTEGYWEVDALYELPVTRYDTKLALWYRFGDADVVERPFDELEIESESRTYGIGIHHPLYRSLNTTLTLGLDGELRRSQTFLFGEPFSFAEGVLDGVSKVTVLRLFQEWIYRDAVQVVAARSQFSLGLDALGATVNPGPLADGQFLSWLCQLQWARRLPWYGIESLLRVDIQLSTDPLLPLEQFAVGGPESVRGYRVNQLVRDNGADASLELRIPLWRDGAGRPIVQLAPFVDYGRSWFDGDRLLEPRSDTLWGVGVGLRWAITRRANFEVYYGHALRDVPQPSDHDAQDISVYARLTWDVF
jgi:hemolysin activation/secretion protein